MNAPPTPPSPRGSSARRREKLKRAVTAAVREFCTTLRHIADLTDQETIEDKDLADKIAGFREVVKKSLLHIDNELEPMLARAEWDRMNIGLYGETQHGKSTLVECLTRGNGASIGTGRKDHTREVAAASIRGMRVLDMPGIEGNEQMVCDQIKAGLHRSHVVLHVLPCDKALDRLTLAKVREHLRTEVVVFALINVFGSPNNFAEAPALRELMSRQIAEIENCFCEHLGDAYKGNFVVAGRVAHATAARGELPPKVQKDRGKAESVFGSLRAARRYSGLPQLERGLRDLREKHFPHLPVLTTLRIVGELNHVLGEVKQRTDGIGEPIEQVIEEVRGLPGQIDGDVGETIGALSEMIGRVVDEHRNQAIEIAAKAIWEERTQHQVEAQMQEILSGCSYAVKREMEKLLQNLNKRIESRVARLSHRIELLGDLADFSGEVDLSQVFEKLRVTFLDVVKDIAETLLALAPALVGGIVGAIAVIIGLVKKIWDIFFGDPNRRKREAQQKAVENLENQFARMKEKCLRKSKEAAESLRRTASAKSSTLTNVADRLEGFKKRLEDGVEQLQASNLHLATAVVHYLDPEANQSA